MTASEAAAAIKAQASGAPGVFSLDQLTAMGKTGSMASQWQAQPGGAGGIIAGGGNGVITAAGLRAGYYRIPGNPGAEYYDPKAGQASAEFISWANGATPDQISSSFIPAEGGPEAVNAANNAAPAQAMAEAALVAAQPGAQSMGSQFVTGRKRNDQRTMNRRV